MERCCTSCAAPFDPSIGIAILEIGDSKTYTAGNTWPATLTAALNSATAGVATWRSDNIGAAATGASYWATNIGARLAQQPDFHGVVLVNIGVNDFVSATHVPWVADMETVLDAIHAKWPTSAVYLMRPWKHGYDAKADEFAAWVGEIVAARAFARLGPDERAWLKGSDDGATMTYDGVHYSAAGQVACDAQWRAVLGYSLSYHPAHEASPGGSRNLLVRRDRRRAAPTVRAPARVGIHAGIAVLRLAGARAVLAF